MLSHRILSIIFKKRQIRKQETRKKGIGMGLDIASIGQEMVELAHYLSQTQMETSGLLESIAEILTGLELEEMRQAIVSFQTKQEKIPWLVAFPIESPSTRIPAAQQPDEFTIVASDGSFMPPDRHSPVSFFLLNMGQATIRYGREASASLSSRARLYFRYNETHIQDDSGFGRPIEGGILGWKMASEEMEYLWEHASAAPKPALAIRDGSLIFWGLQSEGKGVQDALLRPVLGALFKFRDAGIPIVSYISYPGSRDVNNSLRVWLCPEDPLHCQCGPEDREKLCEMLKSTTDRVTFENILRPGERSAVFSSSSEVLEKYGPHRIQFFYMHVGSEIARVEAPEWVVEDPATMGFVQAVLMDQAKRGDGYPPALMEAHEQAVISTEDKRLVNRLLERLMESEGLPFTRSYKDRSKRIRGT